MRRMRGKGTREMAIEHAAACVRVVWEAVARSMPAERGEMCLTYAQHTLPGRQEQQDTINDRRIRLLQYGLPRPCLPFCWAVIFHSPVSWEAVYLSVFVFSLSFHRSLPLFLFLSKRHWYAAVCSWTRLQTLFSWSAFKTAWRWLTGPELL